MGAQKKFAAVRDASPDAWRYTFDTPKGDWVLPGFGDGQYFDAGIKATMKE